MVLMNWYKAKGIRELTPKQFGIAFAIGATICLVIYVIPTAYRGYGFDVTIVVVLAVGSILVSAAQYVGLLAKIRKMVLGEAKRH